MNSVPTHEIDRAWRLALALWCGDEGGAEALVEDGVRAALAAGWRPGTSSAASGAGGGAPSGDELLIGGVVRAFLEPGRHRGSSWGRGPEEGGPRPSLAILSALPPPQRLAVVLTQLEGLTPEAIAALAGWTPPVAAALEREGTASMLEEAARRVRRPQPARVTA